MAEETIPISRATARSDRPPAPSVASWPRATSVISLVSSARTRSRAVRLALLRSASTPVIIAERQHKTRALLLCLRRARTAHPARGVREALAHRRGGPADLGRFCPHRSAGAAGLGAAQRRRPLAGLVSPDDRAQHRRSPPGCPAALETGPRRGPVHVRGCSTPRTN